MKLQIINHYQALEDRLFTGEVELDIEEYAKRFDINDEITLEEILYDYVSYEYEGNLYNEGDNIYDEYDNNNTLIITNLSELLEEYSYLIVPKKELTCCEKAAKDNYRYCPICGNKIVY